MLTDMTCKTAKPKIKPYKIFDGGGLFLRVSPSGTKTWRLKYRLHGKEYAITLGQYPDVGIKEAREKRQTIRGELDQGLNPAHVKLEAKQTAAFNQAQTFELLAIEWQSKSTSYWSLRYAQTVKHRFEKYVFPEIGSYPITSLTPQIVLACLQKIDATAPEMARRVKQYVSQVFKYAIATGRAQTDCTFGLEKALRRYKKGHFASMSVDEFPELIAAIYNHRTRLSRQTYLAIQLMLLTFVRTKELIEAEWSDINFERKLWIIPGHKIKKELPHIVPLSKRSLTILAELNKMNGHHKWVFPSLPRPWKAMSNGTLLTALKRMGLEGRMTGHGFRSLALGILKEKLGYSHEVADRQLAHVKKSSTDRAYDRSEFLPQRIKMMEKYADYIQRHLNTAQSDTNFL